MHSRSLSALALVGAMLAAPFPALAKPSLARASPAAEAAVSAPRQITLIFAEPVSLPTAPLALVMTAMPGMAHHNPMTVTGFAIRLGDDGRTLVATLPRALPAGTYRLTWHAADKGGESADGSYSFTVK
ncbi:copper resistance protein CopC [Sphingomonas sp. R3G8C]|uniref:copper resistance protein CopC n=1 Tax=Novosphingobium rhizosphaerae TaxID=1551649 RepID=UPI0015CD134C